MRCKKKWFRTKKEAKKERLRWNRENPEKTQMTYSHYCEECQGYHNTSIPVSERARITRIMRSKKR